MGDTGARAPRRCVGTRWRDVKQRASIVGEGGSKWYTVVRLHASGLWLAGAALDSIACLRPGQALP
jgi:hypothetical protein